MDIEIKISDDGLQAKHRLTDIPYEGPEALLEGCQKLMTKHWGTPYIYIYMDSANSRLDLVGDSVYKGL